MNKTSPVGFRAFKPNFFLQRMSVQERAHSTLFISYDGLLDPVGRSQILPYLFSIKQHPRPLDVVSFEKPSRLTQDQGRTYIYLSQQGIQWHPITFTSSWGKAGKLWDLIRMYLFCWKLQYRYKFEILHCRSYQAAQVGVFLKKLFGVSVIFDMRGLWVDERVDGGLWPQTGFINRVLYHFYKRIEKTLLLNSDHVVSLTYAAVPELRRIAPSSKAQITVIPCCADFDFFTPLSDQERHKVRTELGIPLDSIVMSYLGSLGTWYLIKEMLECYSTIASTYPQSRFLIITKDWSAEHEELVSRIGLDHLRNQIIIRNAERPEVPRLLAASDVMLSFIKPAYSKQASSPIKFAEALAVGIPVISNKGIGDIDALTSELNAGATVDLGLEDPYKNIKDKLNMIISLRGDELRQRARARLGLDIAIRAYRQIYETIEKKSVAGSSCG